MPTPMDNGYKMVAERHAQFVLDHPNGVVRTSLEHVHVDTESHEHTTGFVVMKCQVWKDRLNADAGLPPDGEGHASMPIPGPTSFTKNSEVENAETSALGRALANVGYHAKDSMASEDEIAMKKVERTGAAALTTEGDSNKATAKQKARLMAQGMKLFGSEVGIREFVRKTVGVYKRTDLTKEHMDILFTAMDATEATLDGAEAAAVGAVDGD